MSVYWNEPECECDHDPVAHDDGFGCTVPGCPCLASWLLDPDVE